MALARWERGLNDVSQHPAILAALRSSSRFRRRVPASGWCTCPTMARPLTCGCSGAPPTWLIWATGTPAAGEQAGLVRAGVFGEGRVEGGDQAGAVANVAGAGGVAGIHPSRGGQGPAASAKARPRPSLPAAAMMWPLAAAKASQGTIVGGRSRIAAVFGRWRTSRGAGQGSQARLPVGQADVHLAAPGRASLSSRMCRSKAWPANTPARSLASRYFTNAPFPIDQRCSRHRPERGNSPNRARRSQPVPTAPGGPDRPAPSPNATAWRGERQSPKQHDRGWVRRARIGLANDSRDLSLAVTGGRRAGCGCRAAAGPPAAVRAVAPAHTNRAMPAHPGQPQA